MSSLDHQTKMLLKELSGVKALTKGDPDISVVRKAYDEVFAAWTAPALRPTQEHWLDCKHLGTGNKTLVVEPAGDVAGKATLVFVHGGGWSLGTALSYAPLGRWLSAQTGLRILVPDFPQAPEHPAPAAVRALSDFLSWTQAKYKAPLVLAGDSAGGNLVAVMSNHPPEGVIIAGQALLYPVLDLRPEADYPSRRKYGRGRHFLTTDGIIGAASQYCGPGQSENLSHLSPILDTDFSRTPPTIMMVPEFDPLHDECLAYAALLQASGVEVTVEIAKGTIHGCASFCGRLPSGKSALEKVCTDIVRLAL